MSDYDNAPELYFILTEFAKQYFWEPHEGRWGSDSYYAHYRRRGIIGYQEILIVIRQKFVWIPGKKIKGEKGSDIPCNIYLEEGTQKITEFFSQNLWRVYLGMGVRLFCTLTAILGPIVAIFTISLCITTIKNNVRVNEPPRTTTETPSPPN